MSLYGARFVAALVLAAAISGCGPTARSPAAQATPSNVRPSPKVLPEDDRAGRIACREADSSSLLIITDSDLESRSLRQAIEKIAEEGRRSRSLGVQVTAEDVQEAFEQALEETDDLSRSNARNDLEWKIGKLKFECDRASLR